MSANRARRIAVVGLVLLLLLPPLAATLPGIPAGVRVGGVALLWWYAALLGPLVAALVAAVALACTP